MENIQQPTSNIEHPMVSIRAFLGSWALDVGYWMFLGVHGQGTAGT
jgi:hypothetical protein